MSRIPSAACKYFYCFWLALTVFDPFGIAHAGRVETVLYSFRGGSDGASSLGGIIMDKSGNIYGATQEGGNTGCRGPGCGTIYKIAPDGTETVLYVFSGGSDGSDPANVLMLSKSGDLYGTATDGGQKGCINNEGCGTAFDLAPDGTFSLLHSFTGGNDGSSPGSGLLNAGRGSFYGVTLEGGGTGCYSGYGCGTVFHLARDGTETVLYSFGDGSGGANPYGQLIEDAAGNLYGTAAGGGNPACANGCGTVFKLAPDGTETVLYAFAGLADGSVPGGGLVMDAMGNLYGAAEEGGDGHIVMRFMQVAELSSSSLQTAH